MSTNGATRRVSEAVATETPTAFSRQALENVYSMSDAILSAWQSINEEWLALVRAQLENSRSLAQSLAECRDPMAAVALNLDGAQATLSRYVTAATKSSNTVSSLASQAWATARQGAVAA
jgi:Phasin protein